MGSDSSRSLDKEEIEKIAKNTGFHSKEIRGLHARFQSYDIDKVGYLTKDDLHLPELRVNPLCDRMIDVLIDDHGSDGKLYFSQFCQVFATFRRGKCSHENDTNSKKNKLKFLFNLYDRNQDGRIDKDELLNVVRMLVGKNLEEDLLNRLVESTIADFTKSDEKLITFDHFCEALGKIDFDETMNMKFAT